MARKKETNSQQEKRQATQGEAGAIVASENGNKQWLSSGIILIWFALIFSLICVTSFLQKSPTVDEPVHLLAGYSYLKWGDFRVNPEHPPLAKLWAALPLLFMDIKDPRPGRPLWDLIPQTSDPKFATYVAQDMLFVDNDAETIFFFAKLQMIALAICLGCFVYHWSDRLFGPTAALISLVIYCFDPNIIAHSQIVHTDIAFSTFSFIGTYYFYYSLQKFNWRHLLLASLSFGLTAITKYSFISIGAVWLILGLTTLLSATPQQCDIGTRRLVKNRWTKFGIFIIILLCSGITAYCAIWAVYGFRFAAVPSGAQALSMNEVLPESLPLKNFFTMLIEYRLFPEAWIYGQAFVLRDLSRKMYFMGELSSEGFWSYFPVTFLVKTPLPIIFLLIAATWYWVRNSRERLLGRDLLIPPVVYFTIAVLSRLNIGVRHILPIYPFLFVFLGGAVVAMWRDASRSVRAGLACLAIWYLCSSVNIYPHYLAFFNELVGGPRFGHRVLVDSNLDWGQDVKGLKRWMAEKGIDKIQWIYFGYVNPEYYGIDTVGLPGGSLGYVPPSTRSANTPRYLAVSANYLALFPDQPFIKALADKKRVATIGYSIHVYDMD